MSEKNAVFEAKMAVFELKMLKNAGFVTEIHVSDPIQVPLGTTLQKQHLQSTAEAFPRLFQGIRVQKLAL